MKLVSVFGGVIFAGLFAVNVAHAQIGASVSADGAAPNDNAIFDIQSPATGAGKGLLIPRVTQNQRTNANASLAGGLLNDAGELRGGPAQGLMLQQVDGDQGLYFNASTNSEPIWMFVGYNAVGLGASGLGGGAALGYGANGNEGGVAAGFFANAFSNGVAVGYQADGTNKGTAVGYQASGANQGTAVGRQANGLGFGTVAVGQQADGTPHGTAVGYQANAQTWGTAVGYASKAQDYGAALGYGANGNISGVAVGYQANGHSSGLALGRQANGMGVGNIAVGFNAYAGGAGNNRIAIGQGASNIVANTAVIRGTLYLDGTELDGGNAKIYFRETFNSGPWSTKAFEIDHPLDPENKILRHFCMESPDVWNVYAGNAQLVDGLAVVELPDYYSALNLVGSEIYGLTVVDKTRDVFPQVKVFEEVTANQFVIAGNMDVKVSWTVKVLRNDPACLEDLRRRPVEEWK